MESREARLFFGIVGGEVHKHADPPHPGGLFCARRERPSCRAAKRDDEFSSPDRYCHATLPRGACNGDDDITPGRAALRDFTPTYDRSGSNLRHYRSAMAISAA
jgi:hypothetical protein